MALVFGLCWMQGSLAHFRHLFFPKTACQVFDALMALIVFGSSGPVFYRIFELFFEMVVSTVVLRFLEETQS